MLKRIFSYVLFAFEWSTFIKKTCKLKVKKYVFWFENNLKLQRKKFYINLIVNFWQGDSECRIAWSKLNKLTIFRLNKNIDKKKYYPIFGLTNVIRCLRDQKFLFQVPSKYFPSILLLLLFSKNKWWMNLDVIFNEWNTVFKVIFL